MTGIQYHALPSEIELELQAQAQMQHQSQSQFRQFPFANFFWVCLALSLLFVLAFWLKPIVKGCQHLIRRVVLHWEIPFYRRVREDGGAGADADDERSEPGTGYMNTSATRQQPLLSPCRALNADKYKYSHISKNGQNSNKDTSTGTDQSEDGVTLTPSRRVNPTTGLMGYVLRPKSRPDYSAMLRPENEEAIYTDSSDGEEDAFTDRPLLASSPIDGDHEGHAEEHGKADAEPEENAKSGQGSAQNWSLFELAARGLEMLHQHDTHGAENGGEANTN